MQSKIIQRKQRRKYRAISYKTIKTTFQSLSNKYQNENDIAIWESKRERDALLWNDILVLHKELTELQ